MIPWIRRTVGEALLNENIVRLKLQEIDTRKETLDQRASLLEAIVEAIREEDAQQGEYTQ